jgi:hypothetical protein
MGVQRIPVTGERHGADFEDGIAAYQVKCRKSIPGWLWGWLEGIQSAGKAKGKAGIVVLKTPRMRDEDALVVLSWRDWVELHGKPYPDFNGRPCLHDECGRQGGTCLY